MLQYAARFMEFWCFAAYLAPNENRKARKFKEGLNHKIYEQVAVLQICNFSDLVYIATVIEKSLKRSVEL